MYWMEYVIAVQYDVDNPPTPEELKAGLNNILADVTLTLTGFGDFAIVTSGASANTEVAVTEVRTFEDVYGRVHTRVCRRDNGAGEMGKGVDRRGDTPRRYERKRREKSCEEGDRSEEHLLARTTSPCRRKILCPDSAH